MMKQENKYGISIIVPVYNIEKYLGRCIDSVLAQSFQNWQLILVDDGSTDTSAEICDVYANQDSRISVIHQKNSGVSAARNQGIHSSCGEYISFIDGDDWVDPLFYETFWKCVQGKHSDCFVGPYLDTYQDRETCPFKLYSQVDFTQRQAQYELLCQRFFGWAPVSKLYRREVVIKKHCYFSEKQGMGEDLWFNWRFFKHVSRVEYVPETGYHYVHREGSAMTRRFKPSDADIITITKQICFEAKRISWRHFLLAKCVFVGKTVGIGQKILQAGMENQYIELLYLIQKETRRNFYCLFLFLNTPVLTLRQRLGIVFFLLPTLCRAVFKRIVLK